MNDLKYRPNVDLDQEQRIGWVGYLLMALIIIFSAGVMEKVADYVKII